MILRRHARPRAIKQALQNLTQPSTLRPIQCRSLHQVPPLGDNNNSKAVAFSEHGVPGFLSPRTFRQNWTGYQQSLVDQINQKTADTEYATRTPYDMHIEFSRQPERADFYNTTAMAHFNHLFWESLCMETKQVPENLARIIDEEFSGIDALRREMLEHGEAMFGNGFVWLMMDRNSDTIFRSGGLKILCTYNAGSPYEKAYRMRQNRDMATLHDVAEMQARMGGRAAPGGLSQRMSVPQNTVGAAGQYSKGAKEGYMMPGALDAVPLLGLCVWQHMYVPDYGVLGKREYLTAWWEKIDWDVVAGRMSKGRSMYGRPSM